MLHPPAQQPQIEPDKHADRYGQRENVRCFYNGEGPDGLSNSSADVAVLHPLDDGGNLLHEKTSVSKKVAGTWHDTQVFACLSMPPKITEILKLHDSCISNPEIPKPQIGRAIAR